MILPNAFASDIVSSLFRTLVSGTVIFLCSLLIYFLMARSVESIKQKQKLRSRMTYVAIFIFIFVLAKIWVDGFSHMLAMLSLVSAGLVITNKESIMNVVGFLIINWRDLFVEGDYIQIDKYSGYVVSIKPFYFKIYQTDPNNHYRITGKSVRIPNSLVITTPITTFSPSSNVENYFLSFSIAMDSDITQTLIICKAYLSEVLQNQHGDKLSLQTKKIIKKNKILADIINFSPEVSVSIDSESDNKIIVMAQYYSYPKDKKAIEEEFFQKLLSGAKQAKIKLISGSEL